MSLVIDEEFNISKASRDFYINFMRDVRKKLGVKMSSYQLPILPPTPSHGQIQFKDMLLRADERNMIRLRLRWDNIYLVGFQMNASRQQGQGGTWMEFNPDKGIQHLIPGSTYLGFTGGYDALLSASNVATLERVDLGRASLLDAVIRLNNPNTNRAVRAKSLIIVLIMICESLRFTYISTDLLAETFAKPESKKPDARAVALMKNWAKLSRLLLVREQNPTHYFPPNPPPEAMQIHNYLDAVAVLGILKEETPIRPTILPTTTIVDNDEQEYYYPLGEPMVEVISVKIDSVCDGLYGTIQVTDGAGSQYLYKTTCDYSVNIKPGEQLILQHNPIDRSILAYDSFNIDVDLKDVGSGVIQGKISWNVFNTFTNVYDQPLEHVIKGECGSVTINYVVLSDAVKAKLEVTLIKGEDDGAETTHVYGDLIARIGKFQEGSVIFKKASNEPIGVTYGQLIPLLKSAVAVPLNSSIIVEANISVPDEDDGFAKCPIEFPAQLSGTSEKSIPGKSGEIRVKVTWDRET